ncbi:MAG: sigma-70 family RNA polymerase sigma factor [Deltaproteobacteria bacterium]|nr:sigma-70 family RNA polymerase sigma factor [Deltaproteobacteria bacterium]
MMPVRPADAPLALQHAFRAGDPEAFGALVRPLLGDLYTVCLRMMSNPVDAEDAAQETLCRAMDAARRYDPGRPLRPWLMTIALNTCRSRLRTVWFRRVGRLLFDQPDDRTPESASEALEADQKVRAALTKLPVIHREALSLFYLKDMTYAEMAEVTGVSIPAMKQRVRRGLPLLKDTVEKMYPDLADLAGHERRT